MNWSSDHDRALQRAYDSQEPDDGEAQALAEARDREAVDAASDDDLEARHMREDLREVLR